MKVVTLFRGHVGGAVEQSDIFPTNTLFCVVYSGAFSTLVRLRRMTSMASVKWSALNAFIVNYVYSPNL